MSEAVEQVEVLEGIYVGHATGRSTGATVVLCPGGAVVERGTGFPTSAGPVPIVPSAILYDLAVGDPAERPDEAMGYAAFEAASPGPAAEGSVGAGTGATVGKLLGRERAVKGGLGVAAARVGQLQVAALAAVNAFGDVVDPASGRLLAAPLGPEGGFVDSAAALARGTVPPGFGGTPPDPSTTLVVATNATLDKAAACRLAAAGSLGVARTIRPVHTRFDGDVVFSLATGQVQAPLEQVGALAADQVAQAIVRAVTLATGVAGVPAVSELPGPAADC